MYARFECSGNVAPRWAAWVWSGDGCSDAAYSVLPEVLSDTVTQRCGCTRMHVCAGNGHSPGETQDAREAGVSPGEMKCAVDSAYIKPDSVVESPVYVWPATASLLFGSPLRRVRGVQQLPLPSQDPSWVVLIGFWLHSCFVWWSIMLSEIYLHAVNQTGAATTASTPLPGTFLGLALDLRSDKLYDLVDDIPDVMGLRALRPSAAIVKVMSVPDSRCIQVVTPDDHVNIGFHEILIHDLADEELPLVTLSKLGCLRLDWPKTLFTFMSRYQFDLDQMWKECRERFGSTQLVRPVVNIYSRIWADISPYTTWSWRSYGNAQCHGVRFGRAQRRTASII